MSNRTDVIIVGGGVVGRCTALFASRRGLDVTVVDRSVREEGASTGNAGIIVPSHLIPLAAPGVIRQGMKWLARPDSPFYIKPRVDRRLLRWLWLFRSHCTEENVRRNVPVLRDLILESRSLFDELHAEDAFAETGFRTDGMIMLHRAPKYADENRALARVAAEAGLDVEELDESGVRERAGRIPHGVTGGVLFRQDAHLDPGRFLDALGDACRQSGVRFIERTAVTALDRSGSRVTGVRTGEQSVASRFVVVAAGAWTAQLLRTVGPDIPLEPAKGYSVTLGRCTHRPDIPMLVADDKVTITPLPDGIRFGGTLALSGFDASRHPARIDRILGVAGDFCPDQAEGLPMDDVWVGFRPASPDGLPYIGSAPGFENLFVATGHGMMGVTLAPVTGRMVADMILEERPVPDPAPFDPGRFT